MRRVGLFIAAGPALGFALILLMSIGVESRWPAVHSSGVFLMFAFSASLLPPVLSGLVDVLLRKKHWRVWGTICAGTAFGLSEMMFIHGTATAFQMVGFCIFGGIPAAVCSWLSGKSA
jgi:hypothetical protein